MTPEEKRAKHAAYMKEYMRRKPDKRAAAHARSKKKRETDPEWREKERLKSLEYARANAEQNRERALAWQRANSERYKARQTKCYLNNPQSYKDRVKQWQIDNPEAYRTQKVVCAARRRSAKAANGGDSTGVDVLIRGWREEPCFTCYLCKNDFFTKDLHIDHVIPVSRGGQHVIGNLRRACHSCNESKGDKTLEEYLAWLALRKPIVPPASNSPLANP